MSLSRPATPDSAIALRVHRMRVARGACWVIALALLAGAALTLLDAATWLSPWVRGLGLAFWLTASGVLGWYFVVGRWRADRMGDAAGTAAREASGNVKAAAAAAVVLLGALLAAVLVPNAAVHVRRVALPWYRAGNPYRIVVTSKDPVVANGEPVVLTAYVESDDRAPLPTAAVLICREGVGGAIERKVAMTADGNGGFRASYSSFSGFSSGSLYEFQYRVESAGATSDWFTVTSFHPSEPGSETTLEVVPPKYAAGQIADRIITGFVPVSGLQYSRLQYSRLELARNHNSLPYKVRLEWRTEPNASGESIPVEHAAGNTAGDTRLSASLILRQSGWLILTIWDGKEGRELKREYPIAVTVTPHNPPRLERLSGVSPLPIHVRPGQKLPVELAAADDIEVGTASLEFALGSAPPQTVAVPLTRLAPNSALGRLEWALPEGVLTGDTVRYRVRVADTRQVPELKLNPQETIYPRTGWATLVVDPAAPPIGEQEIENQRDFLKQGLRTVASTLQEVMKSLKATQGKSQSAFDQETQLQNARQQVDGIRHSFEEVEAVASLTPELRPLAGEIREIAHQRLRTAAETISNATNTADAADRRKVIEAAIDGLAPTLGLLDRLSARNVSLAQARLDAYRLSAILAEQRSLAELAKPGSGVGPEELMRRQKDLHARFLQAIEQSESLRFAMADANRRAILSLASEVSDLAAAVSALGTSLKDLDTEVRKEVLAHLADEATAAADRVAIALAKAESAARLAAFPLPKPESFWRAAGLLAAGKAVESLTELQQLADTLAGVAAPLEKAVAERADAKAAARQYAVWLEDQLTRFRTATQGNPGGLRALPMATQKAIRDELAALRAAADSLALPPGSGDLKDLKADVTTRLREVEDSLDRSASAAEAAMKAALAAMTRLADRLPGVHDRLAAMRGQFDTIRAEQDAIRDGVGPPDVNHRNLTDSMVLSTLRKNFEAFSARQRKQVEAFKALDLPGLELRRERTLAALAAAAADIEAALPFDVYASQLWVRREFEEIKSILANRALMAEDARDSANSESDLQRVQRLAWNRRVAAKAAEKLRGRPRDPAAAEAARAELMSETEVLMSTRVGPAGQFLKQRVRDRFAALRNQPEPDHMPVVQNALADALNELAAMMADIGELTRTFKPAEKEYVHVAADRYLPSKPLAKDLRDLERDYRGTRDRLTRLAAEVHRRTHAAGNDRPAVLQKQRETRGDDLASQSAKLGETLQAAAASRHPEDPVRAVLGEAGRAARIAAKHLADAASETRKGETAAAEKSREEAISLFKEHAKRIAAAAPVLATPAAPKLATAAESLLRADAAMRRAVDLLGPKPDLSASEKAMRSACETLDEAISKRLDAAE